MRTFLLNDDEIISASNSFIGFKVLANASGRKVHWVPMKDHKYNLDNIANHINDYTKIIYIANPDNPMGTYVTRKEFDNFYKNVPERVLIILDEAYFEYAKNSTDYPDSMNYRYDNVITLRSFSKAYGLGGARVGYGFAHSDLINNLMKVKVPFEPSSLAQSAAVAALDDSNFISESIILNTKGYKYLINEFQKINIKYIPSSTNFLTTIWKSQEEANLITEKLLNYGIIVRNLTSFGWPRYIRISIGLEKENQKLISYLKKIL
jgi:histidinol-phosphate aminotransferase